MDVSYILFKHRNGIVLKIVLKYISCFTLSQSTFSMTDGDWPRVMRVNPIFGWGYGHVWKFVRGLTLDYPSLYDKGYTSLGNRDDTERNAALKFVDEDGSEKYRPAYELQDGNLERRGRKK